MIPNPLADTTTLDADADLVAAAQAGSRDALEELITRHQSWIYNIVLRMIYLPQDAEDITQENSDQADHEAFDVRRPQPLSHVALPARRQPRLEHEADERRGVRVDVRQVRQRIARGS